MLAQLCHVEFICCSCWETKLRRSVSDSWRCTSVTLSCVFVQVLDVIAPPYTSDFVQLFLPILENDSIAGTIRTEGEHDPVAEFIGTFQAAVSNKRWCFSFSCEGLRNQTSIFQYGPNSFHCSCSASAGAKKVVGFIRGHIRACKVVLSVVLQDFIFFIAV